MDLLGSGATTRVLANAIVRTWHGPESEIEANRDTITAAMDQALRHHDSEGLFLYAGESAGLIHDTVPVAGMIERMVQEASEVLLQRSSLAAAEPGATS